MFIAPLDCSQTSLIPEVIRNIVREAGDIDILLYNSGIAQHAKLSCDLSYPAALQIIQTNFLGFITRCFRTNLTREIIVITNIIQCMGSTSSHENSE